MNKNKRNLAQLKALLKRHERDLEIAKVQIPILKRLIKERIK